MKKCCLMCKCWSKAWCSPDQRESDLLRMYVIGSTMLPRPRCNVDSCRCNSDVTLHILFRDQ
ncbi:hypothetical protein BDA96_10G012300 [Sorghum bicolor]|uniref:Uncharacterized protein n=1 Tax=Sorghum bicolor TaxID=4558 RepID=A0A921TZG4_SORBI|nr:hypothetical protein BDA96_10G012300 [Sorghum bicolor]